MPAARAIVIPARAGSTRLPGKPLLAETGRPLIAHVVERARAARGFATVVVATDHPGIRDAAVAAGARGVMTRPDHVSGTDRVAEVAAGLDVRVVVNLQGDEPEIDPAHLERVADLLEDAPDPMATLVAPLGPGELDRPSVVKVVLRADGRALFFSRAPIPYQRDAASPPPRRWRHVGLYAYTREALRAWPGLVPSPLERAESLEQLRALEAGWSIRTAVVDAAPPGIDTPEDYRRFVERWRAGRATSDP